jgi:hypothetical protein
MTSVQSVLTVPNSLCCSIKCTKERCQHSQQSVQCRCTSMLKVPLTVCAQIHNILSDSQRRGCSCTSKHTVLDCFNSLVITTNTVWSHGQITPTVCAEVLYQTVVINPTILYSNNSTGCSLLNSLCNICKIVCVVCV